MFTQIDEQILCAELLTKTLPPATHTNTYIIGRGTHSVMIDLGNDDDEILSQLFHQMDKRSINPGKLLLSHHHSDHTLGVPWVKQNREIKIYIHPSESKSKRGDIFKYIDDTYKESSEIETSAGNLKVIHTPGHSRGSVSYYLESKKILFSGDLISGSGYVIITPDEGDMDDYLASLERIKGLSVSMIAPSHGHIIYDPYEKIQDYIQHRLAREQLIIDALESGSSSIKEIVVSAYQDVPESLHGLAMLSAKSHLKRLEKKGIISIESWISKSTEREKKYVMT